MNAQNETTTTPTLAPLLCTREAAAAALAVSVATLDRLIKAGRLRAVNTSPASTRLAMRHGKLVECRNSGAVRVSVESLRQFINSATPAEATK